MTSELKSATARANGAKSRGPKSPETREKSSRNAITHGFTSRKTIVLECECEEDFQELLADYAATYRPGSPVESSLVDEMVAARWRIQRLRMIEAALLDAEMRRPASPTDPQPESTDPGYQIAAAFQRLVDDSRALSFASRYESRLHRTHERYHRTLRELQQSRKQQAAEPISPPPAQSEPQPEPDPELWGMSIPCPLAPAPEPVACPDKKSQNEPKPTKVLRSPRKHVQRRAIRSKGRLLRQNYGTATVRKWLPAAAGPRADRSPYLYTQIRGVEDKLKGLELEGLGVCSPSSCPTTKAPLIKLE